MNKELLDKDRLRGLWQLEGRQFKDTYSLSLVLKDNPVGSFFSSFLPSFLSDLAPREFVFNVNPRSMEIDEPAAVVIKPTQDGGQFIEHQGQIYKNVTIEGTTGLRPNRTYSTPGLFHSITSLFPSLPDPRTGLPVGEKTGFEDLIDLKNMFRAYFAAKRMPEIAHRVEMIWKNGKEGEYYIVEPLNFRTRRDASSPLTTSYTINLRTIKRWDSSLIDKLPDPMLLRRNPLKQRGFINGTIQAIANAVNAINDAADNLITAGLRTITDILRPTVNLMNALGNFANTTRRVFDVPRNSLFFLASNLTDAINSVGALASSYQQFGVTDSFASVTQALRNLRRQVYGVLAQDYLFSSPSSDKLDQRRRQYVFGANSTKKDSGGDPTNLDNESFGSSAGTATIGPNDNIRKLAKRLLGNSARWKALVVMNALKAPYISVDGNGIDVLRPGDTILYPTTGATPQTAIAAEQTGKYRTLSPLEERLGRDIKIVSPKSAGGITQFDFTSSDSGDIELIEGVPNMIQAVRIKFETEQGELPMHPFFGIKYPLGVKAAGATGYVEFDVNVRATLLSDLRIGDIQRLNIQFEGNELAVKADLLIRGFDSALPFDFSTRR